MSAFKKMQNRFLVHWLHEASCLSRRSGVRDLAKNLADFLVVPTMLLLAAAARCHDTLIPPDFHCREAADTLIPPAFHCREAARTVTRHFYNLVLVAPPRCAFSLTHHCALPVFLFAPVLQTSFLSFLRIVTGRPVMRPHFHITASLFDNLLVYHTRKQIGRFCFLVVNSREGSQKKNRVWKTNLWYVYLEALRKFCYPSIC
jgi:hypothetical protein